MTISCNKNKSEIRFKSRPHQKTISICTSMNNRLKITILTTSVKTIVKTFGVKSGPQQQLHGPQCSKKMYGQWSRRITNWYQGHSITKILTSESAWSFFLNRDAFLGQWWRWWRNQVLHKHDLHAWKSEKANEVWKYSRVYLPYSSNKIEHCHHILQVANFQSERSLSLWPWDKLNKSKLLPLPHHLHSCWRVA